jgi:hypothetical protein
MNWKNSSKDELPDHAQEILVCINGVYFIAVYNSGEKTFEDTMSQTCFWVSHDNPIYWSELVNQ